MSDLETISTPQKPQPVCRAAAFGMLKRPQCCGPSTMQRVLKDIEKYSMRCLCKNKFATRLLKSKVLRKDDGVAQIFCIDNRALISRARDLDSVEALYPIAHELGHLVLHFLPFIKKPDEPLLKKRRNRGFEIEASYFAMLLLRKYFGYRRTIFFMHKAPKSLSFKHSLINLYMLFPPTFVGIDTQKIKKIIEDIYSGR